VGTEAEAVKELVLQTVTPPELDSSKLYFNPQNGEIINLQPFEKTPRRKTGKVTFYTAASLAEYTKGHAESGSAAYVDDVGFTITVVLNGPSKSKGDEPGTPGWSDHTAFLTMRETPEWALWKQRDGKLMEQEAFAEHIQEGLKDIKTPTAAEMLELAQSFQAHTDVSFKSGKSLASGKRELVWTENIAAQAGQQGQIAVPEELELVIAPFEGSSAYKIKAWFRFRIERGHLQLGYKLQRPRDVLKDAFKDVVADFQKETLVTPYDGKPTAP
jgi:uncharacterized protein YfdQ (DUF2303 family)